MNSHDLYEFITSSWTLALIAIVIERWLPWPEQWHPVPLFNLFANYLQTKVNKPNYSAEQQRLSGALAVVTLLILTLIPTAIVVYAAELSQWLGAFVLLCCLRRQHYLSMLNRIDALALKQQKRAARALLARICRRDTDQLSVHGLIKTTAELRALSIIHHRWAPVIGWLIGGPVLALALRILTELQQQWPITQSRFRYFGLPVRAGYAILVSPVVLFVAAVASLLALTTRRRPAASIVPSSSWLWPTAKWLDSLSRWHHFALGGPIKVQGKRIERQRFAGRPPEQYHAQLLRSMAAWHWCLFALLATATLLAFIYRS